MFFQEHLEVFISFSGYVFCLHTETCPPPLCVDNFRLMREVVEPIRSSIFCAHLGGLNPRPKAKKSFGSKSYRGWLYHANAGALFYHNGNNLSLGFILIRPQRQKTGLIWREKPKTCTRISRIRRIYLKKSVRFRVIRVQKDLITNELSTPVTKEHGLTLVFRPPSWSVVAVAVKWF
jgi:hypothetical protein